MKVLVTGGTGFTGSSLAFYLMERGYEIIVLDNQAGLFYDQLKKRGATIHLGSVNDREIVRKALQGVQGVFHLAASFRKINASKEEYWRVNVEGTRLLCKECLSFGGHPGKFVYCSTQGVHGDIKDPPGNEDSPILPEDYYQLTKYEGEKVVQEFNKKGLKSVIIRPTAIYGPGDPARFLHLFKLASKGRFLMFGNGQAYYHPVYIDNLSELFLKAFESDKINGEIYLGADEHYFTIKELVQKVGQALDIQVRFYHLPFKPLYAAACLCEWVCRPFKISPPIFRRRVDWFRQNRAFRIDKPKRELGYLPQIDIDEGLKRTAKWYRENQMI